VDFHDQDFFHTNLKRMKNQSHFGFTKKASGIFQHLLLRLGIQMPKTSVIPNTHEQSSTTSIGESAEGFRDFARGRNGFLEVLAIVFPLLDPLIEGHVAHGAPICGLQSGGDAVP